MPSRTIPVPKTARLLGRQSPADPDVIAKSLAEEFEELMAERTTGSAPRAEVQKAARQIELALKLFGVAVEIEVRLVNKLGPRCKHLERYASALARLS